MATSDRIEDCVLRRGRSQSDPSIVTESAIDLARGIGKHKGSLTFLWGIPFQNKNTRDFYSHTRDFYSYQIDHEILT